MILLKDIPYEGLTRRYDLLMAGEFGQKVVSEAAPDSTVEPGLAAEVTVNRQGRDVIVVGTLEGKVHMACSRCVEPVTVPIAGEWGMTFVPKESLAPDKDLEMEVPEDKVDVAPYEDECIDLENTFREELMLALPVAPVCAEDCRGLCPRCGQNLNQGACECPPEPKDDRWAALRNVKVQ